jgi:hypothetical protein
VRDVAGVGTGAGIGVGRDLGNRLGTGVGRQGVGKGASASREIGFREATGDDAGLGTGGVARGGSNVGPKQRGAGGCVREGREPRVGEPVAFCGANF